MNGWLTFDPARLANELGDVAWYAAALASVAGLRFSAVLQGNLDKLAARYPAGWSAADSRERIA